MKYKIDFHVHTNHSEDGVSSLQEQIAAAKQKGLHGLAIADHNLCTAVTAYEEDDFLLIPSCEVSTTEGHVLGLFLRHPIPVKALWGDRLPTIIEATKQIHQYGGMAVLAHPYHHVSKVYEPDTLTGLDGIEVYNARATFKNKRANEMAKELATQYDKLAFAGSDGHSDKEVGNAYVTVTADALDLAAIRTAMEKGDSQPVLQKETAHYRKGISQIYKAVRTKKPKKIGKSIAYMGYCIYLDCFKRK